MKAFLEIDRKNFFIGLEKKDFSFLENFENFKVDLYILNSKEVHYIDKTNLFLKVMNDHDLVEKDRHAKNQFRYLFNEQDLKMLMNIIIEKGIFSYEIIISLHTFHYITNELYKSEKPLKVKFLEDSFVEFSIFDENVRKFLDPENQYNKIGL
ncbi:MAG: hypothetical protein KBD14_02365 [Candidatus Pacebacteria bacterium]|nr:hypothetical protein [Candidatus Paceibacterota bacterium]